MTTDLYLRASDQAELETTLIAAGVLGQTGVGLVLLPGFALDIIGQIETIDGSDMENPVVSVLTGWHANLRAEDLTPEQTAALAPITIPQPETPFRVWA